MAYSKDFVDHQLYQNKLINRKMNSYKGLHENFILRYNHMLAVVETSFFLSKNIKFFDSKLNCGGPQMQIKQWIDCSLIELIVIRSSQQSGSWGHTLLKKSLDILSLSLYPWKFYFFFKWPENSACSFFNPPFRKFHVLSSPCLDFSGIAHFLILYHEW